MDTHKIHSYSNKHRNSLHTFLIIVPIFVFVIVLAFIISRLSLKQVAWSTTGSSVLGVESQIDK